MLLGAIRSQTGTSSRVPPGRGYTGELYTPATGLLHLRARDLNPTFGRFLSADTVQPCPEGSHPGSQGFNVYAYVAKTPLPFDKLRASLARPKWLFGRARPDNTQRCCDLRGPRCRWWWGYGCAPSVGMLRGNRLANSPSVGITRS